MPRARGKGGRNEGSNWRMCNFTRWRAACDYFLPASRRATFSSRSAMIALIGSLIPMGPESFQPVRIACFCFSRNCSRLVTSDSQRKSFCSICRSAALRSLSVSNDFPPRTVIITAWPSRLWFEDRSKFTKKIY